MTQTREARLNTVIEYSDGDSYFLYDPDGGHHTFALDSPECFDWLNTLGSFHFKGKLGHFTGRSERKKHGDRYWYAYRKANRKLYKRYLGATEKLTFEWKDDLLSVKTPSERHYLNRTQTIELLSYLYDQRGTLLRKEDG